MFDEVKIKLYTYKAKIAERKNKTHISHSALISDSVTFEGCNYVGGKAFLKNCDIGYLSYVAKDVNLQNVSIGRYTSIGPSCKVVYGDHPIHTFVSTHPAFYKKNRIMNNSFVSKDKFNEYRFLSDYPNRMVRIGNDVWIASDVTIIGGIHIGNGAVIASGSVVTKDVPDFAVVGGVPAKVIKYRFSKEQIEYLNRLKWWDKNVSWIKKNADLFQNIELLISSVNHD